MLDRPVIGMIAAGGAGPIEGFATGLTERGQVVGQNIRLEQRIANGDLRKLPVFAAEFVRQRVDLIAAIGAVTAHAVRSASPDIPAVYSVVVDPVRDNLAESMRRPGGNMTGVTTRPQAGTDARPIAALSGTVSSAHRHPQRPGCV
jgi:putative ABC transport system substrate-binding protein